MKSKLLGLVSFILVAVPDLVLAGNLMSPWGFMNEVVPWDASDIKRPEYEQAQPRYPTRPIRTLRQRQKFSRPINHTSVDIEARLPEVPVYIKRENGTVPYSVQIGVLTPEYQAMSVVGYPAEAVPSDSNRQLELNCEIESIRRWDRGSTHGWSVRVAATFNDKDTVKLLEKAKTVLMAHGVCYPLIEKRGQLSPKGVYEYHAAFISHFEDSDKTAVVMEIGTGLRFNSAGNGYLERSRVEVAFTVVADRNEARIKYR